MESCSTIKARIRVCIAHSIDYLRPICGWSRSEFGAEDFDPKRWINAALDARHPSEPLDRFLASTGISSRIAGFRREYRLCRRPLYNKVYNRKKSSSPTPLQTPEEPRQRSSEGTRAFSRRAPEMVVVDASEFGAEDFDPKRWINAALDARHPSEPLDRFLASTEISSRIAGFRREYRLYRRPLYNKVYNSKKNLRPS
jgi:hypothetical protein